MSKYVKKYFLHIYILLQGLVISLENWCRDLFSVNSGDHHNCLLCPHVLKLGEVQCRHFFAQKRMKMTSWVESFSWETRPKKKGQTKNMKQGLKNFFSKPIRNGAAWVYVLPVLKRFLWKYNFVFCNDVKVIYLMSLWAEASWDITKAKRSMNTSYEMQPKF